MAGSSEKKLLALRRSNSKFYNPIRLIAEAVYWGGFWVLPYLLGKDGSGDMTSKDLRYTLITTILLTLTTHYSYASIQTASEASISGSSSAKWDKGKKDDNEKGKEKIPGSEDIDFFFLFSSLKVACCFFNITYMISIVTMALYVALKMYRFYVTMKNVTSGFTGKKEEVAVSGGVEEEVYGDRKERKKALRKKERERDERDD